MTSLALSGLFLKLVNIMLKRDDTLMLMKIFIQSRLENVCACVSLSDSSKTDCHGKSFPNNKIFALNPGSREGLGVTSACW